jgi:hypothetical protein
MKNKRLTPAGVASYKSKTAGNNDISHFRSGKDSVSFVIEPGSIGMTGNGKDGNAIGLIFKCENEFLFIWIQNRYLEIRVWMFDSLEKAQECAKICITPIGIDSEMLQPLSDKFTGKRFDSSTQEGLDEILISLSLEIDNSATLQGLSYSSGCWHPAAA